MTRSGRTPTLQKHSDVLVTRRILRGVFVEKARGDEQHLVSNRLPIGCQRFARHLVEPLEHVFGEP